MIIGNKNTIAFDLKKTSDEEHLCQLKLYINGKNICEWKDRQTGEKRTIWWNLDELISYLYETTTFLYHDEPFPYRAKGESASEMENNARDFDSEDESAMDEYYDRLNDWVYNHSWNHARSGAIVPDIIFRNVDGNMEISWWNDDEDIDFTNRYGFITVPAETYKNLIDQLFTSYNSLWL